jgi:hypothetical protein
MGYPVASGSVNYSSTGANNNSQFIPEIWSKKLLTKYYENCVYMEISNTDYEGEIKDYGDKVNIRTVPDITINDYEKGQNLSYEEPESAPVSLTIDQGHYFAFKVNSVDEYQSDINLMDTFSQDGAMKMKRRVDSNILGSVYAAAASVNAGATAGKDSGSLNLGTAGTPLDITKANIVDVLVERCGVCLDETDTPDEERFVVLPPSMCARIKTSELKDASLTGDGNSTLRSGKIGMIDRLHIYSSRNLRVNSGAYDVLFGHKSALSFAAQITEMETLPNPNDFGQLVRSLFVYGFDVLLPEQLGHGVWQLG